MKAKYSWSVMLLVLVVALGLTVACSRAVSDAQLTSQVQGKIAADRNVQSRQITVQAANGVVILSGNVSSEMERSAAAGDAAQIDGVKTVVNNLTVAAPAVAQEAAPAPEPAPEPVRAITARRAKPSAAHRAAKTYKDPAPETAPTPAPVATSAPVAAAPAPAPVPVAPPEPPPVQYVTVPEGTQLSVRITEALDSQRSHIGDVFHGTLSQPVVVGDRVVIPAYADVEGRVVDAKDAAHFSGRSALALDLSRLSVNGKSYDIHTDQWAKEGAARGKNTAEKVGGGAAIGAIIGAIAGGGKGAAIGAGVGAGAGTTAQAATRGEQVRLPSESVINFRLETSISVIPTSSNRDSSRPRVE